MYKLFPARADSPLRLVAFLAAGVWIQTVAVHIGVVAAALALLFIAFGGAVFAFAYYVFRTRTAITVAVCRWVGFVLAVAHMFPFISEVRASTYATGKAIVPVLPSIIPLVTISSCAVGVWLTYLLFADLIYMRNAPDAHE